MLAQHVLRTYAVPTLQEDWHTIRYGDIFRPCQIKTIKANGEPLILISHNMRQVFDLADRILVFRRGRIVANLEKTKTTGEEVIAYITGAKSPDDDRVQI